jgi:hypothetical protein
VGQAGSGRSLASFAAQLNTNDSPLDPEVEQTELDGTKVVVVRRQDGSELYVANTGDAYPLRANDKGKDAGSSTSPNMVLTSTSSHPGHGRTQRARLARRGREAECEYGEDLRGYPDQPHAKRDGGIGGTIARLQ